MAVQLLTNVAGGVASTPFDVSPAKGAFGASVIATGTVAGDKVEVEISGSVALNDFFLLNTITVPGILLITTPVERVRAIASLGNAGTVSAYYESGV